MVTTNTQHGLHAIHHQCCGPVGKFCVVATTSGATHLDSGTSKPVTSAEDLYSFHADQASEANGLGSKVVQIIAGNVASPAPFILALDLPESTAVDVHFFSFEVDGTSVTYGDIQTLSTTTVARLSFTKCDAQNCGQFYTTEDTEHSSFQIEAEKYQSEVYKDSYGDGGRYVPRTSPDAGGNIYLTNYIASADTWTDSKYNVYNEYVQSSYVQWFIDFPTTGTYYLWMRCYSDSTTNDAVNFAVNFSNQNKANDIRCDSSAEDWVWANDDGQATTPSQISISSTGINTLQMYLYNKNVKVDSIILTKDSIFTPDGPVLESLMVQDASVIYSTDDATEAVADSSVTTTGDIILDSAHIGGVRLSAVRVDETQRIYSAFLTLTAKIDYTMTDSSDTLVVRIYANAVEMAHNFSTNAGDLSSRALTGDYVEWSMGSVKAGTAYTSPDFGKLINDLKMEEKYNCMGYDEPLVLILKHASGTSSRSFYSQDDGISSAYPSFNIKPVVRTDRVTIASEPDNYETLRSDGPSWMYDCAQSAAHSVEKSTYTISANNHMSQTKWSNGYSTRNQNFHVLSDDIGIGIMLTTLNDGTSNYFAEYLETYFQLRSYKTFDDTFNAVISAQAKWVNTAFSNSRTLLECTPEASVTIPWKIGKWLKEEWSTATRSPDLRDLFNAVYNEADQSSNTKITIIIRGDGTNGTKKRQVYARKGCGSSTSECYARLNTRVRYDFYDNSIGSGQLAETYNEDSSSMFGAFAWHSEHAYKHEWSIQQTGTTYAARDGSYSYWKYWDYQVNHRESSDITSSSDYIKTLGEATIGKDEEEQGCFAFYGNRDMQRARFWFGGNETVHALGMTSGKITDSQIYVSSTDSQQEVRTRPSLCNGVVFLAILVRRQGRIYALI